MKRKWIKTNDGSNSLHVEELDETYHSRHGAVTESKHVFIEMGWRLLKDHSQISILEVGFGTGTNCLLTLAEAGDQQITYHALEPFPLSTEEWSKLDSQLIDGLDHAPFVQLADANNELNLNDTFQLKVLLESLQEVKLEQQYDLIYYDAFGPRAQPEMWTPECFEKMFNALNTNGVFVTYCAKGQVRRDLQNCGFDVERLPGPPGKREMLRASKK